MSVQNLAVATVLLAVFASPAAAQTFEPARLPDGRPDLQGVWDFRTLTPLQRPEDQADKAVLTAEEAAEVESQAAARTAEANAPSEVRTEPLPVGGDVGGYNRYWVDQGAAVVDDQRTSLIVDPPDGRLPPLRSGIELDVLSLGEDLPGVRPVRVRAAGIGADSYEDRGLSERCLLGFNSGPPIVPAGYNQNIQIFQTPDHVVILHEMVHDARIVPLGDRDHLPDGVRQWMGSSARLLGWRHAGGRDEEFHRQDRELQPVGGDRGRVRHLPAPDRALPACGRGHPPLRVHRRRLHDLYAAVHRGLADEAWRGDVRVRVPRGELRAVQPAVGRARRGGGVDIRAVGALSRRGPAGERVGVRGLTPSAASRGWRPVRLARGLATAIDR